MADDEEDKKEEDEGPREEIVDGELEAVEPEGDEDGEESDEKSGMDIKKIILFVAVPLILLIGVAAGLYFTGMLDPYIGKKEEKTEGDGDEYAEEGYEGDGLLGPTFVAVPPMIVNLNNDDGIARFLRLSVQLELKSGSDEERIQQVLPRVVDQFQTYLRELRIQDLRGSAGIYRLQMELLWRVNQAAYPVEIKDVLFQEILIQ